MPIDTTMIGLGGKIVSQAEGSRIQLYKNSVAPREKILLSQQLQNSTQALEAVAPSEQTQSYRAILEKNIAGHQQQLDQLTTRLTAMDVELKAINEMDQNAQSLLGGG